MWRTPILAAPVLLYLAGWLALGRLSIPSNRSWHWTLLCFAVVASVAIAPLFPKIIESEQLLDVDQTLRDRWRLQQLPAIAPTAGLEGQPQVFYIFAPGTDRVSLRFSGPTHPFPADHLGHGLFRIQAEPKAGPVHILYGKQTAIRNLATAPATAHPRWFCMSPQRVWPPASAEKRTKCSGCAGAASHRSGCRLGISRQAARS